MSDPPQNELIDRAWEAYDAELAGTHRFAGVTRQLPSLIGYVARIAWLASRKDCAATVGCDIASGLMSAFCMLGTTQALTALMAGGPTPGRLKAALPALLFIGGITVTRTMLNLASGWAEDRLVPKVTMVAERRLYTATTRVDLAAYDTPGFYDALQRARGRGLAEAPRVIQLALSVLVGITGLCASVSVLAVLSPVLLPLLLVAAAPDAWAALRSARMRYQVSYELGVSRRRKLILADLMADRRPAAEVRSFNMRDFLLRSYDVLASYERAVRLRLARRQTLIRLAGDAAAGAGMGLVYLALAVLLSIGWIGLPVAGTAVLTIQLAVSSLSRLLVSVNQCYESGLYFSDYLDFCQQAEQGLPHAGSRPAPPKFDVIRASGIGFSYPGSARAALTDVSVEIRRGEVIALVGENGSGKTTLAKLLAGLYEPCSGEITWDGRSLADVDREQLRERIAVIMQDYTRWPVFAPIWMLFLSCILCSTGSIGGGIKMFRTLVLSRQALRELRLLVHPSAVAPVRVGGKPVPDRVAASILAFIFLYFMTVAALTFALLLTGLDFDSSFGAIIACINNAGPGLGVVGPFKTYQSLTDLQTWICTFAMLLGRLEIFSVLVLFTPTFWRK